VKTTASAAQDSIARATGSASSTSQAASEGGIVYRPVLIGGEIAGVACSVRHLARVFSPLGDAVAEAFSTISEKRVTKSIRSIAPTLPPKSGQQGNLCPSSDL